MSKLKIQVYVPTAFKAVRYLASINYILKMSHELTGKHPDQLEWLPPYSGLGNSSLMMEEYENSCPDIVCCGVYLWNQDALHEFVSIVKEKYPNTVTILGGPDVAWKTQQQYANDYPYHDYMIYGDSEAAFPQLIDNIIERKTSSVDLINIPNLIFRDKKGTAIRTKHEIYKGSMYTDHSPWLHSRDDVVRDINAIKDTGVAAVVSWDSDRGCPYKCTFCDWSAGLHTKVTRKKYDAKDELQFFAEQGVRVSFMNANLGIYAGDADIMEFIWAAESSGKYPGFTAVTPSWAKVNKDRVHEIYQIQKKYFGYIVAKTSLQSITEEVLKNIDRPSIPWPEHKKMLLDLRKDEVPVHFYPELIVGLPGETRESWDHMMREFTDLYPIQDMYFSQWHILPNSPGFDKEYQKKMGMKIVRTAMPFDEVDLIDEGVSEDRMVQMLVQNEAWPSTKEPIGYHYDLCLETYSSTFEDLMYMNIATGVMFQLQRLANPSVAKKMYDSYRPVMWEKAQRDVAKFRRYMQMYGGIMPLYLWHENKMWQYREAFFKEEITNNFLSKIANGKFIGHDTKVSNFGDILRS